MVLTCMKEAKRLVDMAYKERRERWGARHFPALRKAAPGLSEWGLRGRGWSPLSISLCVFGFENTFKTIPPRGLASVGHPGPYSVYKENPFSCLWVCLPRPACWPGARALLSVPAATVSGLTPPFSKQHQAAASQWPGQPHGTPVLLQAAGGSHQDSCEGC